MTILIFDSFAPLLLPGLYMDTRPVSLPLAGCTGAVDPAAFLYPMALPEF